MIHADEIVAALTLHGPMTQDQLARYFTVPKSYMAQKLSRMKADSYIEVVGSEKIPGSNYKVPVYGIGSEPVLPKDKKRWTEVHQRAAELRAKQRLKLRATKLLAKSTPRVMPDLRMTFVFNLGAEA